MKKLILIVSAILFSISMNAQKSPARLSTDTWNSIKFNRTTKGLTVFFDGKQNGANVVSSDYTGKSGQKWRFKYTGREGIYYIIPSNADWNCLAAVGGKLVSTNLKNDDYYKWKVTRIVQDFPSGYIFYYSFQNVGTSRYIYVNNNVLTMSYSEQRWTVDKVGDVNTTGSGGSGNPTPQPSGDENVTDYDAIVSGAASGGLNFRSGPGSNYEPPIDRLNNGTTVKVTHKNGSWLKIIYNNKIGYVYSTYLKRKVSGEPGPSGDRNVKNYNAVVKGVAYYLNVRSGPSSGHSSLGKLYNGNTVKVTHKNGEWLKIIYNNKPAYVFAKYLERKNSPEPQIPTNFTKADAKKYAPLLYLHPNETHFPMNPNAFIRNSKLTHDNGGFGTNDISYNKRKGGWNGDAESDEGDWDDYHNIPLNIINSYKAVNGKNRHPRDKNRGNHENVMLQFDKYNKKTKKRITEPVGIRKPNEKVPVIYDIQKKGEYWVVSYWYFFGFNPGPGITINGIKINQNHQGDWEHCVLIFDRSKKLLGANLYGHSAVDSYKKSHIRFSGSHPIFYISKGTHATKVGAGTYPSNLGFKDYTGRGYAWKTWNNIKPLNNRKWRDFAGAWGELGHDFPNIPGHQLDNITSGPLGPWYKRHKDVNNVDLNKLK